MIIAIIAVIVIIIIAAIVGVVATRPAKQKMILTSPSFNQGAVIPAKFTCDGENVNPELNIRDVPPDAKSLVLIMDDPDAPGGTFTHWTVWNINPRIEVIKEGSVPAGLSADGSHGAEAVEGKTSFGRSGYGGPCPPAGKPHRYFFKLYALDTVLNVNSYASVNELRSGMNGHVVAEAELMGTYQR